MDDGAKLEVFQLLTEGSENQTNPGHEWL